MNQKSKLAGYKEQVVNMQAQIDKLEFENDAGKETIDKLSKDNKVLQEKLKTAIESDEKLINVKDELQLEIKSLKDEKCEKFETEKENTKLKDKIEFCEKVIDELKSKENETSRKLKDLQDDHEYSEIIHKVDKKNLERDLVEKAEESVGLLKQINDLTTETNDQQEEINGLKKDLEIKESSRTKSSCGSLGDELDSAYLKLENDIQKEEVGRMKIQIEQFEENKMERFSQLEKLEKLSSTRQKDLDKLKNSLEIMMKKKKQKCKYKWKCWWPQLCSYDHTYLYRKINICTAVPLKEKKIAETTKYHMEIIHLCGS